MFSINLGTMLQNWIFVIQMAKQCPQACRSKFPDFYNPDLDKQLFYQRLFQLFTSTFPVYTLLCTQGHNEKSPTATWKPHQYLQLFIHTAYCFFPEFGPKEGQNITDRRFCRQKWKGTSLGSLLICSLIPFIAFKYLHADYITSPSFVITNWLLKTCCTNCFLTVWAKTLKWNWMRYYTINCLCIEILMRAALVNISANWHTNTGLDFLSLVTMSIMDLILFCSKH